MLWPILPQGKRIVLYISCVSLHSLWCLLQSQLPSSCEHKTKGNCFSFVNPLCPRDPRVQHLPPISLLAVLLRPLPGLLGWGRLPYLLGSLWGSLPNLLGWDQLASGFNVALLFPASPIFIPLFSPNSQSQLQREPVLCKKSNVKKKKN